MNLWLLIALMTLVTYLPRYLPMGLAGRIHLPPSLERALEFVPVAVLTAIVAQSAFIRDGQYDFSLGNFHAIAALAAFFVALITKRLFVTIAAGLGCFVVLRLVFGA